VVKTIPAQERTLFPTTVGDCQSASPEEGLVEGTRKREKIPGVVSWVGRERNVVGKSVLKFAKSSISEGGYEATNGKKSA